MRAFPLLLAPVAALTLAACQPDLVATPAPEPDCGAAALQGLVGQPLGVFAAPPQARAVRVIGPDMAVTMDYRPDRLNVEHDRARIIRRVYCS